MWKETFHEANVFPQERSRNSVKHVGSRVIDGVSFTIDTKGYVCLCLAGHCSKCFHIGQFRHEIITHSIRQVRSRSLWEDDVSDKLGKLAPLFAAAPSRIFCVLPGERGKKRPLSEFPDPAPRSTASFCVYTVPTNMFSRKFRGN